MAITQEILPQNGFREHELVMWHDHQGNQDIPVPGVVVRQESEGVIIRVRVQGTIKEQCVDPKQLMVR